MHTPRLRPLVVVIGLSCLACTGLGPSPDDERAAIERLAKEKEAAEAQAEPPPAPAAPKSDAPAPKWDSDTAIAAAIGSRHYLPTLMAGEPYAVPNPDGGDPIALNAPEVVLTDAGQPRAYPTGDTTGHAIGKATSTEGGTEILLDYSLVWDANATAASGDKGLFEVTGFEVLDLGEGERFTFHKSGDFYSRKAH